MQKEFTVEFIKENCGCYNKEGDLSLLGEAFFFNNKECCYNDNSCIITALEIANSIIPLKDKYWFFCYNIFSKEQSQQIVTQVTEAVLPLFEEKGPEDLRHRKATKIYKAVRDDYAVRDTAYYTVATAVEYFTNYSWDAEQEYSKLAQQTLIDFINNN